MLEESISCSPGCETKRSQYRRFHKRLKGRERHRANPTSSDVSCLEGLYEDTSSSLNSTQYEHFNPFENEQILAAADLVRVTKSSTSLDPSSGGFVRLQDVQLNENDLHEQNQQSSKQPERGDSESQHAQYGPETQFGITESEFVRFCDDVEMDAKESATLTAENPQNKKTVVQMILDDFCLSQPSDDSPKIEEIVSFTPSETPLNKKSIVESILEDFCSSPYVESPPKLVVEEATPVFRFRSKPIRTYAGNRRRRLRRNIETELVNADLSDDDGSVSDSSGLSVQEDFTQNAVPNADTIDLNSSIRVCENLLHLSSYFSQSTSHDKTPEHSEGQKSRSSEEQKCRSLSAVVEQIMQLKRKSQEVTRRKSSEEFYGFSDGESVEEFCGFSDEENKSHEDTLKELLEAEDDILQEINCDSLCYEKVQPKSSFSCNMSELEIEIEKAKSVIEDARNFMQSIERLREGGGSPKVCDNLKSLPRKLSHESPVKEEKLFEEVDIWIDNECLLNYVTQKPNVKQEKCVTVPHASDSVDKDLCSALIATSTWSTASSSGVQATCSGFSTASKKPIAISAESKRKAYELLSKFEQSESDQQVTANGVDAIDGVVDAQPVQTAFLGFTTASRKPVVISGAARLKADQILRQFEQEEQEQRVIETMPSGPSLSAPNENTRKSNELSEEAKQKAEELLKDIEFFEDGFDEEDKFSLKDQKKLQPAPEGFKTASKKPIVVSDEAKQRADRLVREIETEDVPNDFLMCIQADFGRDEDTKSGVTKVEMAFEGFKTASKKPIQISEAARQKAEQLFKKTQTDDLPSDFIKCIQTDSKDTGRLIPVQGPCENIFEGFKTASRKPIKISDAAKQRAEQMLKEIETAALPEEYLKCIQTDLKAPENEYSPKFEGFKTASKKPIKISETSKQRAEQILKEIEVADLPQDYLKCIQADLKVAEDTDTPKFEGFKTASKKPIAISEAAKQRAEQLLRVIESEGVPQDFVNTIEDISVADSDTNHNTTVIKPEVPTSVSPQKAKEPDNRKTIKRKSEDVLLQSPKRRFSCNERTRLNDIENAPLHKATSHPEMKSTSKMSKKNLLSLSKRKKYNSPKAAPKTPEKSNSAVLRCNANTTPNLQEFFDCVTTSTPRLIRTNGCKTDGNHKDASIDVDFQKINWENASNSSRVCKTTSFTDLNVTCVEVSPSPKQRIERLKMYGEPPPISPILMVNKCRPSGLRRGRSLMKP